MSDPTELNNRISASLAPPAVTRSETDAGATEISASDRPESECYFRVPIRLRQRPAENSPLND